MAVNNFNGSLNSNEVFQSIFNMIISQQVFADNVKGTYSQLADMFKTDGTLYGDTKLFYATDVLKSRVWGGHTAAEASNLLAINRPEDPECQAITLDQFRQIDITVDNYLSKRAWSTEGAFNDFQSVILGWIKTTKRIYESTLINTYVGTVTANDQKESSVAVPLSDYEVSGDLEATNRLRAQTIAKSLADLFVNMKDVSRDYNSYGFLRSYDTSDLIVVWNAEWVNKITKYDLPTLFHKEGLIEKFEQYTLPAKYFGNVVTTGGTVGQGALTTARALNEMDCYATGGQFLGHVFAGESVPATAVVQANEVYTLNQDIICKVLHKDSIKYMSAFEVATSFFNPRSLTENHYLTWGYSNPAYLYNYPVISVTAE